MASMLFSIVAAKRAARHFVNNTKKVTYNVTLLSGKTIDVEMSRSASNINLYNEVARIRCIHLKQLHLYDGTELSVHPTPIPVNYNRLVGQSTHLCCVVFAANEITFKITLISGVSFDVNMLELESNTDLYNEVARFRNVEPRQVHLFHSNYSVQVPADHQCLTELAEQITHLYVLFTR